MVQGFLRDVVVVKVRVSMQCGFEVLCGFEMVGLQNGVKNFPGSWEKER